jgi:hypothetical protein
MSQVAREIDIPYLDMMTRLGINEANFSVRIAGNEYVLEKIKQGEGIFADETILPTLAPGSGKA